MLLARFWYIVLSVVASAGLASTFLARSLYNREHQDHTVETLRRDHFEIEAMLELSARTRLDALGQIAQDKALRALLLKPTKKGGEALLEASLKRRLRAINRGLQENTGDILTLVSSSGALVASVGDIDAERVSGFAERPLVKQAIGGTLVNDVWDIDGKLYLMTAYPILGNDGLAGALVHGKKPDDALLATLSKRLGNATIGIFLGESLMAGSVPRADDATRDGSGAEPKAADAPNQAPKPEAGPPSAEQLATLVPKLTADDAFRAGKRSTTYSLGTNSIAVFAPVKASSPDVRAYYGIARTMQPMTSGFEVFKRVASDDVRALPWVLLSAIALALAALGFFFVWLERDRSLKRLRSMLDVVVEDPRQELNPGEVRGVYRRLAESMHQALVKRADMSGSSAPKDLSNTLDKLRDSGTHEVSFFGMAANQVQNGAPEARPPKSTRENAAPTQNLRAPEPPAPGSIESLDAPDDVTEAGAPPSMPLTPGTQPMPERTEMAAQQGIAFDGPTPPRGTTNPAIPGQRPARPSSVTRTTYGVPAPRSGVGIAELGAAAGASHAATGAPQPQVGAAAPATGRTPSAPKLPAAAAAGARRGTPMAGVAAAGGMVAQTTGAAPRRPAEANAIVANAAAHAAPTSAAANSASSDAVRSIPDKDAYRSLYDEFCKLKAQCNEPINALTYERFLERLAQNRETIMADAKVKDVRFEAYIKNGKASIKAIPVRPTAS